MNRLGDTDQSNSIVSLAGNDVLPGNAGNDTLAGGDNEVGIGSDSMDGGDDADLGRE